MTRPGFYLRELKLTDAIAITACIRDSRFAYPLLTGGAGVSTRPVRAMLRSFRYTLICLVGNRLGPLLFGGRRHWIMAVVAPGGKFAGCVMLDEVQLGDARAADRGLGSRFLKHPERRLPLREGDGELGFFLHPAFWGQQLGVDASRALTSFLANPHFGKRVLRRVWAETGVGNAPARRTLEELGLVARADLVRSESDRFDRDGDEVTLIVYEDPKDPLISSQGIAS